MRICLMIEGQEGVTWDEWLALARAVESARLEGLFRSDHYTSFHNDPGAALDAWATIAALGPMTSRIRLGTLVSPATFRHPSELARVAVTADHSSGGRVEVGVGAGWFEQEHRQNGFEFAATGVRLDRLAEYVEVLLGSWSAATFDYAGEHFTLQGQLALPAPVQSPHPPLILGGRGGPRSLAMAARYADEYNSAFVTVEECRALRTRIDDACRADGRDPDGLPLLSWMGLVATGRDHGDAERRLTRALERFGGPRDRCHVGTLDEMAAVLGRLEEAGVTRVYLQHPDRSDFEGIELLGELATRVAT